MKLEEFLLFYYGIERSEVKGPILQFQSTIFEKEDILKLIKSINQSNDNSLEESLIDKSFVLWWPKFKEEIEKIEIKENVKNKKSVSKTDSRLEEILELSRRNQRLLNNPERLFPPEYLDMVINRNRRFPNEIMFNHPVFRDLSHFYRELYELTFMKNKANPQLLEEDLNNIFSLIRKMGDCIDFIERHSSVFENTASARVRFPSFSDENT